MLARSSQTRGTQSDGPNFNLTLVAMPAGQRLLLCATHAMSACAPHLGGHHKLSRSTPGGSESKPNRAAAFGAQHLDGKQARQASGVQLG
jgi:hypothetical protein